MGLGLTDVKLDSSTDLPNGDRVEYLKRGKDRYRLYYELKWSKRRGDGVLESLYEIHYS